MAASPIEKQLLAALVAGVPADMQLHSYKTAPRFCAETRYFSGADGGRSYGDGDVSFSLYRHASIASYKVDFLLELDGHREYVAIECDGHEWHERSKEQASSDRARDRALLALGFPTIRFTGSDIFNAAKWCAEEVFRAARTLMARAGEEQLIWCSGYDHGVAHANRSPIKTKAEV